MQLKKEIIFKKTVSSGLKQQVEVKYRKHENKMQSKNQQREY